MFFFSGNCLESCSSVATDVFPIAADLASTTSSSSLTNQLGRDCSAMGRPSLPAFKTYAGGLVETSGFLEVVGPAAGIDIRVVYKK